MSIRGDANNIITLTTRFEKESNPAKKAQILKEIGLASENINKEISSNKKPTYYDQVIEEAPPSSKLELPKKEIKKVIPKNQTKNKKQKTLTPSKKKKLLKEINVDEYDLKRVYKKAKKRKGEDYDFTVYVPSPYGSLSNRFFGDFTDKLLAKKSPLITSLSDSVKNSGMN
ncbi:hypothetical protein HOK09_00300, partial [Candidatus Woesearchaeota archaeon]|nr:hypothetical protein [Candidatus Woesearchaeota archaeon]